MPWQLNRALACLEPCLALKALLGLWPSLASHLCLACLAWLGLATLGFAWPGLAWLGLARQWLGKQKLAWLGRVAWLGLGCNLAWHLGWVCFLGVASAWLGYGLHASLGI